LFTTDFHFWTRKLAPISQSPQEVASRNSHKMCGKSDRTVGQMINGVVEHLAYHLGFVIEKRRALGID